MKFDDLLNIIHETQEELLLRQVQQVNFMLTIRNWLIGFYVVEFEQKGEDRAEYGEKLLSNLAKELRKKGHKGFSETNLILNRQFYITYGYFNSYIFNSLQYLQISRTASEEFKNKFLSYSNEVIEKEISQTVSDKLFNTANPLLSSNHGKDKTLSLSAIEPKKLLTGLTFSHFIELLKLDSIDKRIFYEMQAIKLSWSVRQLRREVESLLYERIGLSKNKRKMLDELKQGIPENSYQIIKNPYILDFLGIKEKAEFSETELETAIINNLQKFLLEMGYGFCFEARQKRIVVDNITYKIDLVFYHRVLKCHVLIDLKVGSFSHADAGQMNFYLNYYKDNEMYEGDNAPIGIILCSYKNETLVKYATGSLEHDLFVSKYLINLPSEEKLKLIIEKDLKLMDN